MDFDPSDLTGREFVCLGEFQKLSRRLILQSSGPMPHMTPNESVTLLFTSAGVRAATAATEGSRCGARPT